MRGTESDHLHEPLLADSVTFLDATAAGRVVVCASHGGAFVAVVAARHEVAAIVLHDAGVGLEGAGIAGLAMLDDAGVAAVAVDSGSARIGDATDTFERGRLSFANRLASELGCAAGMSVAGAVERLLPRAGETGTPLPPLGESATRVSEPPAETWALDSVSAVGPELREAVVVTGSHGGLLGGRPETALKADTRGAVYNDAGGGMEGAGRGRLPALDKRGIPAAVVDCRSARIGDARSTYETGVITAVNETARARGAEPGMDTREFTDLIHQTTGKDR